MALSSVGFNGTVNDIQWASLAPGLGQTYTVDAYGHLKATAVAGVRNVTISAGSATGRGVKTTLSADETVALPIPAAGQWHLLVLRRVTATKATTLVAIPHTTTVDGSQYDYPGSYPAAMHSTPGVDDDQPLWWAFVGLGNTDIKLVDLRKVAERPDGLMFDDAAARDAYLGVPVAFTEQLRLQRRGLITRRVGVDYREQFYAPYHATYNPLGCSVGGVPTAGWWPVAGSNIFITAKCNAPINNSSEWGLGGAATPYVESFDAYNFLASAANAPIIPKISGRYTATAISVWAANAVGGRLMRLRKNGSSGVFPSADGMSVEQAAAGAGGNYGLTATVDETLMNGTTDNFEVIVFQNSGAALSVNARVTVKYDGPPVGA